MTTPSTTSDETTTSDDSTTSDDDASTTVPDESGSTTAEGSCGNDVIDGDDQCDGTDLGGEDCETQGFDGGTLACDGSCAFDVTGCFTMTCGNDTIEGKEACDGRNLDDQTCALQGFDDGVLACAEGCAAFDTSGCIDYVCGDDVADPGESCDGTDLAGEDCASQGAPAGVLACLGDCSGFDTAGCVGLDDDGPCCAANGTPGCAEAECEALICGADPYCCDTAWDTICAEDAIAGCEICMATDVCGNGISEAGESCDGFDVGGETCVTQSFDAGTLACAPDCSAIDTSGCVTFDGDCCSDNGPGSPGCEDDECTAQICADDPYCCNTTWDDICADAAVLECAVCFVPDVCGNNVIDGMGEVCDNADLAGETCVTQGFDGGTLGCAADCSALDISGCTDFSGDCCAADATPGCDDAGCTADVCAQDPYCCDTAWDASCANVAVGYCTVCGGGMGDCCTMTGDVGCNDAECTNDICGFGGLDATCCNTTWDTDCTNLATMNCSVCM